MNDDLEELLDAERDIDAPSAAERERMAARLAPLLLPLAAPTPDVATTAASAGSTSAAKLVIVSLISAAVGAGGGAAGHAYYASRQPAPVVAAAVSFPAPMAVASVEPLVVAPIESVAVAAPSASVRVEEPPKPASSLRAERLLLETASAALMKGDHASAIAALKQHQARYPKGELAQEREVLLVQALKASGDSAGADERAKDFKKKFPGSLQQDSVDKASKPK
jgi:TolA-binding protein